MNNNKAEECLSISGKVFITGANGFIGRALAIRCRELGAEVSGLDFKADPEWGVVAGDLSTPDAWCSALEGVGLVIHTAAIVSNTASMDLAWSVNVEATAALLQRCKSAGVSRFLQLSSVAAYGFDATEEIDETRALRPMGNTYVDTKIASEHIVLACHASGEMDCTIVRPGDVYGPRSRPWVTIPLAMAKSGKFVLPAHGKGLFSPVYIDDIVHGILLASYKPEGAGQIFNISGGVTPTCEEFFGHHARMVGSKPARTMGTGLTRFLAECVRWTVTFFGGSTEMGGGTVDMLSRKAGYSIAKAEQLLGYSPEVDLMKGMRRTELWARNKGLL